MATKIFHGIEQATWFRIKAASKQEHGTVHADGSRGLATTMTPLGPIIVDFTFDAETQEVSYTIVRKPFLVGENQIWDGIEKTIAECNPV